MKTIEKKYKEWIASYFQGFSESNPTELIDAFTAGHELAQKEMEEKYSDTIQSLNSQFSREIESLRLKLMINGNRLKEAEDSIQNLLDDAISEGIDHYSGGKLAREYFKKWGVE